MLNCSRIPHWLITCVQVVVFALGLPVHRVVADDLSIEEQRDKFRQAWEAINAGAVKKGFAIAGDLENYPLYPYLRFNYLRPRLHKIAADEVHEFLSAYDNSVLAERLRSDWLRWLSRSGKWRRFVADYRPQTDVKLRCLYLLARIRTGALEGVAQDAKALWLVGKSQPDECDPAFAVLYKSNLMSDDLVWQRIHLAMQAGQTRLAGFLTRKLTDPGVRALARHWLEIHNNPQRTLRRTTLHGDPALVHTVVLYGIRRAARRDVDGALRLAAQLRERYTFSSAELGSLDHDLALAAEHNGHPMAGLLLDKIPEAFRDVRVDEAKVRWAIGNGAWQQFLTWSAQPPVTGVNPLTWRYWRARSFEINGDRAAAAHIYSELARHRDYYGFLAADILGLPYRMNDTPTRASELDKQAIVAIPGITRARELVALGYFFRARREWYFETAKMTGVELEAASLLAHDWGWHDRAILTLAKAQSYDDLTVRFPTEYHELISRYATKRTIDEALLFSIIRAESAFMTDVRSPAGAIGLMQVMPATGREVAKKIGFRYRHSSQLANPQHNVTLGSAYLRELLDRYDNNFAMAAAAYNAGPHRVAAWLPKDHCTPADIWIELLPFKETRLYVMRTLFYAAIYEWRLKQEVTALDTRLADIPTLGIAAAAGSC